MLKNTNQMLRAAMGAVILILSAQAMAAPPAFPGLFLKMEGEPRVVAKGDLNGDGAIDFVTVNASTEDISILLGRGDGSFAPETRIGVGDHPRDVVIGDLNSDGAADLVTVNAESDDLSVLFGLGDGSFAPEQRLNIGENPAAVVIADFNADGALDLAVSDFALDDVGVLLGMGDGTFGDRRSFAAGPAPAEIVVADFNTDGALDLAVGSYTPNDIIILLGDGAGGFASARHLVTSVKPERLAIGDLNGDGIPDLAAISRRSSLIAVFLAIGDGAFGDERVLELGVETSGGIAIGDLNGDGVDDLVAAGLVELDSFVDPDFYGVVVLLADGAGDFALPQATRAIAEVSGPVLADVDGDGALDLAMGNRFFSGVLILRNQGDGVLSSRLEIGLQNNVFDIAVGDVTLDGVPDIVATDWRFSPPRLLRGMLNGAVELRPEGIVDSTVSSQAVPEIADMNGDGRPDLLLVSSVVEVFLNDGAPMFDNPSRSGFTIAPPRSVSIDDVNNDGALDVLVANGGPSVSLVLGNGDGTLRPTTRFIEAGEEIHSATLADLNADSRLDLIATDSGNDDIVVRLGLEFGTFDTIQRYPVGSHPTQAAVADFDGDGALDIAVGLFGDGLDILFGDGAGGFAPPVRLPVANVSVANVRGVTAADVNGDGAPDLVVDTFGVTLLLGVGDGTFEPLQSFAAPSSGPPGPLKVADLNRDGRVDIATSSLGSLSPFDRPSRGSVSILFNQLPPSAIAEDLDGDGVIGSADLAILLNRWGTDDKAADVNADGVVDIQDLGLLLAQWD